MKTCAYTISGNELKYIDQWMYYTKDFDYRCILVTTETKDSDGTFEKLQELVKTDPGLIIERKVFIPWNFSVARNYNLAMIPSIVDWCLSPDMDEYFSINVLEEMTNIIRARSDVTNISCDRLDIYSKEVRVGPPKHLGANKIHRRHDYIWKSPIYEHLSWKYKDRPEVELYSDDIYLIHDQDFRKPERGPLYLNMLIDAYESDPQDSWCLWFLVNHYFKEQDLENFIKTGCDYLRCAHQEKDKSEKIMGILNNMYLSENIDLELKRNIKSIM